MRALLLFILVAVSTCIEGQRRRRPIEDLYSVDQVHPYDPLPDESDTDVEGITPSCRPIDCSSCPGSDKCPHCEFTDWCTWGEWGSCSHTCGGGSERRCRQKCICCTDCSDCDMHGEIWYKPESRDCNRYCFEGNWDHVTDSCKCDDEYYGYCCDKPCPVPEYCEEFECTEATDSKCVLCENKADSVEAYHLEDGECTPKCNWLGHDCYPGTCDTSQNYLYTTCECMEGFVIDTDKYSTKCVLTHKPVIQVCSLGAESVYGEAANSTFTVRIRF